tara:strand:+ start:449 stop:676 length:228 start_codon:yes stop_codon:yes gene_type:complete
MNLELKIPEKINIDNFELQKMIFIYNALEEGWQIKKNQNKYIFSKRHENKKEIYLDSYLETFLTSNIEVKNNMTR